MSVPLLVRRLGQCDYRPVLSAMQRFTARREAEAADELWLLEHRPVFTLGLNGKPEHLLAPGDIPVIPTDRGGQVTYHGPGQLVVYCLIDLKRAELGVRALVTALEQSVIALLADYGIPARTRADAPGVYVKERKIASIGLRIRRSCSYHGLSLNVAMDLEPFSRINPCGYAGLRMTQLCELGIRQGPSRVGAQLLAQLCVRLGHTSFKTSTASPLFPEQENRHVTTADG